jgi:hypothetical protein
LKKNFTRQLAWIEHWKARIRHLRQKLATPESQLDGTSNGHPAADPAQHYHIGATENHPLHISTFHRDNSGDPAIKACTLFETSAALSNLQAIRIFFRNSKHTFYCDYRKPFRPQMQQPLLDPIIQCRM